MFAHICVSDVVLTLVKQVPCVTIIALDLRIYCHYWLISELLTTSTGLHHFCRNIRMTLNVPMMPSMMQHTECEQEGTKSPPLMKMPRGRCTHLDLVAREESFTCVTCDNLPKGDPILYCEECILYHTRTGHKVRIIEASKRKQEKGHEVILGLVNLMLESFNSVFRQFVAMPWKVNKSTS